jgi:ketosteroid isomerase-like protein
VNQVAATRLFLSVFAGLLLFLVTDLIAETAAADSASIRATIDGFHRALGHGDRAAALQLLAPDAVILESGEMQTREEYQREHLGLDIAFAQATKTERSEVKIEQQGNDAWAIATSKTTGMFQGRKINRIGVELIVLSKSDAEWRIRAIHWSDRKAK